MEDIREFQRWPEIREHLRGRGAVRCYASTAYCSPEGEVFVFIQDAKGRNIVEDIARFLSPDEIKSAGFANSRRFTI